MGACTDPTGAGDRDDRAGSSAAVQRTKMHRTTSGGDIASRVHTQRKNFIPVTPWHQVHIRAPLEVGRTHSHSLLSTAVELEGALKVYWLRRAAQLFFRFVISNFYVHKAIWVPESFIAFFLDFKFPYVPNLWRCAVQQRPTRSTRESEVSVNDGASLSLI